MKPLVDLTSRALARMIEGKTPEEIRETFHLPDDLTGAVLALCTTPRLCTYACSTPMLFRSAPSRVPTSDLHL